jgi:hypothetical protein
VIQVSEPTFKFTILDEETAEMDCEVPGKYDVCPRCHGHGSITNPSIGAITGDEWERDWSPEEREDYVRGVYDVTCPQCQGLRVVVIPDRSKLTDEDKAHLKQYRKEQREAREVDHMMEMERRFGA